MAFVGSTGASAGGLEEQAAMSAPAADAVAVVPSDTVNLVNPARSLYIGTTGDVEVITYMGNTVVFKNVPVGILSVRCTRVKAGSTTASNIIALM